MTAEKPLNKLTKSMQYQGYGESLFRIFSAKNEGEDVRSFNMSQKLQIVREKENKRFWSPRRDWKQAT